MRGPGRFEFWEQRNSGHERGRCLRLAPRLAGNLVRLNVDRLVWQLSAFAQWQPSQTTTSFRAVGTAIDRLGALLDRLDRRFATTLREGGDVTIVCMGTTVAPSLDAAQLLAVEGIEHVLFEPTDVGDVEPDRLGLAEAVSAAVTLFLKSKDIRHR